MYLTTVKALSTTCKPTVAIYSITEKLIDTPVMKKPSATLTTVRDTVELLYDVDSTVS